MGLRDKTKAMIAIPDQMTKMTLLIVTVGIVSIIALAMASMAVRRAN